MRIEKISDTQVKFVLLHSDLEERNIKMNELVYGSDKIHHLFQEMMQMAQSEYEFMSENTPLMVEAMRVGADTVVVIVTKIADSADLEKKLSLIPQARNAARFKCKPFIETRPESDEKEDSISIFSFDTLDMTAEAVSRLKDNFLGISQLYKCDSRYFLLLQNETEDDRNTSDLEALLFEYGQKHVSNILGKQYLSERGEALITEDAVGKLGLLST